jgi:YD repeat-containing protein
VGQTFNFTGTVSANGALGTSHGADGSGGGGGGAVRIDGNTITVGTVNAIGGTWAIPGGSGRVAVYYKTQLTTPLNSSPSAYISMIGQSSTPTPTPTPISFSTPSPYGTGADGDIAITSGTFNLNTDSGSSRSCAAGIAYSVTTLSASSATLSTTPASGCLAAGDEVLLINLQGTTANYANTGNYEFLKVGGVTSSTVYFTTAKANYYGASVGDDSNIGTGAGQQRVMLMRVPNYHNVTISGTLTANAWNGLLYGVVAFRASGTVSGNGTVTASGLGFLGGGTSQYGESYVGRAASFGGGAPGGDDSNCLNNSGGAGAYGADGQTISYGTNGAGGKAYGDPQLNQIFFGSGGGPAGTNGSGSVCNGNYGANGGGIIWLVGQTFNFSGTISANGALGTSHGADGSGGGGGGAVRIDGNNVTLGTVTATGGTWLAYGGSGRTAVYYQNSFSATNFSPNYLQWGSLPDSIFSDDFETNNLTRWSSTVTDGGNLSASSALSYLGTIGLQAVIPTGSTNPKYVVDNSPANEAQYNARFYVNPMGMAMGATDTLDLFDGYNSSSTLIFRVQLQEPSANVYKVRVGAVNNSGTWAYSSWVSLGSNWNGVEVDYQAGTSGSLALYVNGVSQATLTGINNGSLLIDSVRLGVQSIVSTTRGTLYFDNFDSRRFSFIGTLLGSGLTSAAGPGTYDDTSPNFSYTGSWVAYSGAGPYNSTLHYSDTAGATATFTFSGTKFTLLYTAYSNRGNMDIYVDGSKIATLNSYNANLLWQQSWNSPVFTDSTHTVQFVNVSAIVDVDAITVYRTGPSVLSSYTYADTSHDHAVTSVAHTGGSTDTYQYDANGNMTCRVESGKVYVQTYNAENRMAGAMQVSGTCASWGTILATWTFTYDGDGSRVKQEYTDSNGTLTTYYFMGGAYEKRTAGTTTTTIKYYSFGGQTIMNDGTGLKYFLTDHASTGSAQVWVLWLPSPTPAVRW